MGRTTGTRLPTVREPALDGIRAIAVLAVVAFHGEITWASGGFLGVDVFFVLSGYLITRGLLAERRETGEVGVSAFWSRRMRRILPALLLLCAALVLLAIVGALPLEAVRTLPGDAGAALLSMANWHFIATDQGYFGVTATPSLLEHTWSLSIEEQFYLLWAPLAALVLLRRRSFNDRRGLVTVPVLIGVLIAVALSAAWMATRAGDAWSADQAYWDTLARLQGPLIGAALAFALSMPITRNVLHHASPVVGTLLTSSGLAVLATLFWRVDSSTQLLFPGGFLLAGVATAAVIAGLQIHPLGAAARGLSIWPLAAVGLVSYGVYLWHWPLLFVLTGNRTGLHGVALHALRLAVTIALATASYLLVERRIQLRRDTFARTAGAFAVAAAVVVIAMVVVRPSDTTTVTTELAIPPAAAFEVPDDVTIIPTTTNIAGSTVPVPGEPTDAGGQPPAVPVGALPETMTATSATPTTRAGPTTTAGPPVRVAIFGDSVAESIARALGPQGSNQNVRVIDDSIFGCGVAPGAPFVLGGTQYDETDICLNWRQTWQDRLDHDRPDVAVFVLGRHEILDRQFLGNWTAIGDPSYDDHLRTQVEVAVDLALDRDVPVVLLTAPFYVGSEAPGGGIRPENQPARVHRFNALLASVVTDRSDARVHIVDLGGMVSPNGRYASTIDGVTIRSDGVHFAASAGGWLAPRLLPPIVATVR